MGPHHRGGATALLDEAGDLQPIAASARRVLIAGDDACLTGASSELLRADGWHVDTAPDAASFAAFVRDRSYRFILIDLGTSGMDGLAALSMTRDQGHPADVVALSSRITARTVKAALQAGAADVLKKPVDTRSMVGLLDGYDRSTGWSETGRETGRETGSDGEDDPASSALLGRGAPDPEDLVGEILGPSPAMRLVREQIVNVSQYRDMSVLIVGETGTGKELVAQAIHRLSAGEGGVFAINCAAVPEDLFESEVFGHEAGSFTGARGARTGLFEEAKGGTVFLDEVGEMPAPLQAKLLRVLETRSFRRVGSSRSIALSARVVSATNRRLGGRGGDRVRSDLFFRLAGYTIRTPPLRERMEDIEVLTRHLLGRFVEAYPTAAGHISPRAIEALHAHDWPGNVRELRGVVNYSAARANGGVIGVREIAEALEAFSAGENAIDPFEPKTNRAMARPPAGLRDMERDLITRTYQECQGNLTAAAERLRIPRTTLRDKLRRYGVR